MRNSKMAYLYLTLTTCAWGSLYVVSKFVLGKVPPFTVLFLRYLVAGLVLGWYVVKKKPPKIAREDFKILFGIGFIGYFFSVGAQLVGIKFASASVASLINSMNPVVIILLATLILKEKFTREKLLAVMAVIAGTYFVIGGVGGHSQLLGIIISIIAVVTWGMMTVLVRKITQKYDALAVTTYGMIIAAGLTLPVSLYELTTTPGVRWWETPVWLGVLYIGLVCTALAHGLWNKSLSMLEAGTCALFYPLQPVVSILLGTVFLGERITAGFIWGAVLIIGGVLFGILGKKESAG